MAFISMRICNTLPIVLMGIQVLCFVETLSSTIVNNPNETNSVNKCSGGVCQNLDESVSCQEIGEWSTNFTNSSKIRASESVFRSRRAGRNQTQEIAYVCRTGNEWRDGESASFNACISPLLDMGLSLDSSMSPILFNLHPLRANGFYDVVPPSKM